mmetsp:Transcript_133/g.152  ORF Transcript_133/g.152 Transcript_133/m.152 type:complete len:82 (+) Transcript_133:82-327(+)
MNKLNWQLKYDVHYENTPGQWWQILQHLTAILKQTNVTMLQYTLNLRCHHIFLITSYISVERGIISAGSLEDSHHMQLHEF